MQEFTIAQIEKAVNAWREAEGVQNHKLGLMTRTVADVYGRMIFDRANGHWRHQADCGRTGRRRAHSRVASWPASTGFN
jgi:hypothetical protein